MSDYKKKRQEAMSSGFKREYGPSMGAKVDTSPCTICGQEGPHRHGFTHPLQDPRGMDPIAGPAMDAHRDFRFIAASFVSAPQCETCGEPMEYLKAGTEWACRNGGCNQQGVSVTTGVGGVVGSVE